MTKWTTFGLLLLVMETANALEKAKPRPKETKVSVSLSFSVAEYDPTKPSKAVMKCVVRNNTDKAIQMPVGYDGNHIRLYSTRGLVLNRIKEDDLVRLERKIKALKGKLAATDEPETIISLAQSLADTIKAKRKLESQVLRPIEAGKERVIFEFPLDNILLQRKTKDGGFKWDWSRRPAPPKSPIYLKSGSRDLVAEASFAVRLTVGNQTVDSTNVRLKVKTSN